MKAKKVYEFKRTRKQGLSKQTEIGLTVYKRKEIEKWFKKYAPNAIYEIKDDLSVIVNGVLYLENTNITELPFENLTVNGFLNLDYSGIEELPDTLSISGSLYLEKTKITELPDNLNVKNYIYISKDMLDYFKDSKFKNQIKVI